MDTVELASQSKQTDRRYRKQHNHNLKHDQIKKMEDSYIYCEAKYVRDSVLYDWIMCTLFTFFSPVLY